MVIFVILHIPFYAVKNIIMRRGQKASQFCAKKFFAPKKLSTSTCFVFAFLLQPKPVTSFLRRATNLRKVAVHQRILTA